MGLTIIMIICFIVAICRTIDDVRFDNSNAHDIDHNKMMIDSVSISKRELKRRYNSGYYNKK